MFLSGNQIKKAITNGDFIMSPFEPKNLNGASYTFTLGNKAKKLKKEMAIDARDEPEFEEFAIDEGGYEIKPGEFAVFYTREKINLKGKYVCLLSTRATIAQMGLDVTQGSFLCEPDTDNPFALEITNKGPLPIRLYPGLKIVKGLFGQVI